MYTDGDQFIRLPEVKRLTGLCKSTIYRLEELGLFPRRRKIGPRAVAWLKQEVLAWMEQRPHVNGETPKSSGRNPRNS